MNKKRVYRNLVLSGEISEESAQNIIQHINDINEDDHEPAEDRVPIQLKINSIGGSMYDGFAIIGAIESSITPVYTCGYGAIMSMALPILLSGHKRFAHKLTSFMYHECLSVFGDYEKVTTLKENLEETERISDMYDDYILSKTSLTKKQLDKVKKGKYDWYFDADDALEYKIIDQII
jgi:ATP-dependent Clp protease protease subunit